MNIVYYISVRFSRRNAIALTEPRAGSYERPVNIHVEAASVGVMQIRERYACVLRVNVRVLYALRQRGVSSSLPRREEEGKAVSSFYLPSNIATRASVPAPDSMRGLEPRDLEEAEGRRELHLTTVADE